MNYVSLSDEPQETCKFSVRELIKVNFNTNRTAFIGECGCGRYGLYLITYDCIVFVADPRQTWCTLSDALIVIVDKFVDVKITVEND